jgi:hypothetical protein
MEVRYDEEEKLGTPKRIIDWINAVLKGQHQPCTKDTWRNYHYHLRDGVVLCKLINVLLKDARMQPVKFKSNALTAFVAMENIELFTNAAQRYGLPESDVFQSADLYEGHKAQFVNIINCINSLGFLANEKGFEIPFEGIRPTQNENCNEES